MLASRVAFVLLALDTIRNDSFFSTSLSDGVASHVHQYITNTLEPNAADAGNEDIMLCHLEFWLCEIVYLLFVPRPDSDRKLLLHHIVTSVLIALCIHYNMARVGIAVSFLHDISDIFISLSKILHMTGWEEWHGYFATEISFVFMFPVWVYTRLYQFALVIMACIYDHNGQVLAVSDGDFNIHAVFVGLLSVLYTMQVAWTFSILRVAVDIVTVGTKKAGDSCED